MKLLIYGAGAVGGYIGARLAQHGHQTSLITREVTAELINTDGLFITENGVKERTNPQAITTIAQAFAQGQQYDLIIMSMKSYDLVAAMDPLVAFCPNPATIITTGNGIGIEEPLISQFGAEHIIAGSLTTPIRKETSNDLIVERADRGLTLAAIQPRQKVNQWVNLFEQAAIPTTGVTNYQAMKWSKALLNMVGNATSAILNRRPGIIYQSDAMFQLEVQMLKETLAVMRAQKIPVIDLPGSPAKRLAFGVQRMPKAVLKPILTNLVANGRGDKMPSFHIDLSEGKGKSEVVFHNGAVAAAGKKLGVATPVNAALNDVLLKLTLGEVDWREYNGRPKRLLAEVQRYEAAVSKKK